MMWKVNVDNHIVKHGQNSGEVTVGVESPYILYTYMLCLQMVYVYMLIVKHTYNIVDDVTDNVMTSPSKRKDNQNLLKFTDIHPPSYRKHKT